MTSVARPLTTIELQRVVEASLNPSGLYTWIKSPSFPETEFCWVDADNNRPVVVYRHKEAMIAVEIDENSPILIDSETFRYIEDVLNIFNREDNYENTPG